MREVSCVGWIHTASMGTRFPAVRTELSLELSFKERDPIDKNLKKDVLESVIYWKKYLNKNL